MIFSIIRMVRFETFSFWFIYEILKATRWNHWSALPTQDSILSILVLHRVLSGHDIYFIRTLDNIISLILV